MARMRKRRIGQRDLPHLLAKLEEGGAANIQRRPAGFHGTVEVRWEETRDPVPWWDRLPEDYRVWLPVFIFSGFSLAVIITVFVLVVILGG